MKILIDTNIILDVMLDRAPFSEPACDLLSIVEHGKAGGFVCATTVTTIHYLASKVLGKDLAQEQIEKLVALLEIAPVNRVVIKDALRSGFSDFEEAIVCQAAYHAVADAIVTRDRKGFKKSEIPVYSPTEILNILRSID